MALLDFLGSTTGRWVRGVVGVVLLVLAFLVGGTWGWVLGALGVVFVAVGLLDVCLPVRRRSGSGLRSPGS